MQTDKMHDTNVKKCATKGVFSKPENVKKLIELRNLGVDWDSLGREFGVVASTCMNAFKKYSGCSKRTVTVFIPTVEEVAYIYYCYKKGDSIGAIAKNFDISESRLRKFIENLKVELGDYDAVKPLSEKAKNNVLESRIRYVRFEELDAKIKERYFILGNITSKAQIIRAFVEFYRES